MSNYISIYLVKEDIEDIEDILKEDFEVLEQYNDQKIAYYKPSYVASPDWLSSFLKIQNDDVKIANSKAVVLVSINFEDSIRIFALTFGRGKFLLKDNVIEDRFGLKILLNTISSDDLRKINKVNIGGNQKSSNEQIPKKSSIVEFGFDINRDLMTKVSAYTDDETFGKCVVTGGDLLSLTVDKDIDDIDEFLSDCYVKYTSNRYRQQFDWVDNIYPVKDSTLRERLDETMIRFLNQRSSERVWLAVPEVIEWDRIQGFKYSGSRELFFDISLEDFINIHGHIDNSSKLINKRIKSVSAEDDSDYLHDWSAYKCVFAEIDYAGKSYCLNNGKWYLINSDFVQQINNDYESITLSENSFIDYNHENEGDYNAQLASSLPQAVCMDCQNIMYGGGYNRIELCDVLTIDKKLIHIKHNGGSSYMSHLFNQATVSGELLSERTFQSLLNEKLHELEEDDFIADEYNLRDYTVVFGVITKGDGAYPKIPFFSRVSIKYAVQRLRAFGYSVEIANIKNIKS